MSNVGPVLLVAMQLLNVYPFQCARVKAIVNNMIYDIKIEDLQIAHTGGH